MQTQRSYGSGSLVKIDSPGIVNTLPALFFSDTNCSLTGPPWQVRPLSKHLHCLLMQEHGQERLGLGGDTEQGEVDQVTRLGSSDGL